jgi:hypothetical protein
MLRPKAVLPWLLVAKDVLSWGLHWLGKFYDAIDTVSYARKLSMSLLLTIWQNYTWLIGFIWLGVIAFWPERKPKTQTDKPTATTLPEKALFSLCDVYQEPENLALTYKWKLRIVLSNDTKEILNIQELSWKGAGKVSFLLLPVLVFEVEDGLGVWVGNQWSGKESQMGLVSPGQVFRTWVGLNQRYDDTHIRWRQISKLLGTLSIKVAGHAEQKVRV